MDVVAELQVDYAPSEIGAEGLEGGGKYGMLSILGIDVYE